MSEGEKMVWAAAYVAAIDRGNTPYVAMTYAAKVVEDLRRISGAPASSAHFLEIMRNERSAP
jgi:hypothetical protein